jgi:large subunit ribosomal protein L10e
MALRPGRCYAELKDRAYTRLAVKVHKKNYIGAAPGLKTRQFNTGNPAKDFNRIMDLIADEDVQIRDNALESVRLAVNRYMFKFLGKEGYFMKVRVYPHHILRENKQAQGAGADRISKGMSLSFGTPIGRAARVKKGSVIISVLLDEKDVDKAKPGMMRANPKLPCAVHVEVGSDVASIGTKPKKTRILEEKEEEKAETTEAEGAVAATDAGAASSTDAKKGEGKKDAGKADDKKAGGKPAAGKPSAGKK